MFSLSPPMLHTPQYVKAVPYWLKEPTNEQTDAAFDLLFSIKVPVGAKQATVILKQSVGGRAFFHVYENRLAAEGVTPFIVHCPPRQAGRYSISFAIPPKERTLFFRWGEITPQDTCWVGFT